MIREQLPEIAHEISESIMGMLSSAQEEDEEAYDAYYDNLSTMLSDILAHLVSYEELALMFVEEMIKNPERKERFMSLFTPIGNAESNMFVNMINKNMKPE